MKCFRCGGENTVKKLRYNPETSEPRDPQIVPDKWVLFRLGESQQFGLDTRVTLCQSYSGDVVKLLRGEAIPAKKVNNQEVLKIGFASPES